MITHSLKCMATAKDVLEQKGQIGDHVAIDGQAFGHPDPVLVLGDAFTAPQALHLLPQLPQVQGLACAAAVENQISS